MLRFNIALAIAPALLLLWIFRKWDAKRPEPVGAVRNVVLLGMLVCIPAAIIEWAETGFFGYLIHEQGSVLNAFVVAALTEETLKLIVVLAYLWRKPHFDEVMDGILYTAASSLGFAILENILYSANNPIIGFVRAFTAVPLHATASGIMGYFVGRARYATGRGGVVAWLFGGLAVAVGIHGLYDWTVMSGGTFGFAPGTPWLGVAEVLPLIAVCGLVLWLLVRHALKLDDIHLGNHPRPLVVAVVPQPAYAYAAPYGYVHPYPMPVAFPPGYAPPAGYAHAPPASAAYPQYAPNYARPDPYANPAPQHGYGGHPYPEQAYASPAYAPPQPAPEGLAYGSEGGGHVHAGAPGPEGAQPPGWVAAPGYPAGRDGNGGSDDGAAR